MSKSLQSIQGPGFDVMKQSSFKTYRLKIESGLWAYLYSLLTLQVKGTGYLGGKSIGNRDVHELNVLSFNNYC